MVGFSPSMVAFFIVLDFDLRDFIGERLMMDKEALELAIAELKAAIATKKLVAKRNQYTFLKDRFLNKAAKLELVVNFLKMELTRKGVKE